MKKLYLQEFRSLSQGVEACVPDEWVLVVDPIQNGLDELGEVIVLDVLGAAFDANGNRVISSADLSQMQMQFRARQ